MGWGLGQGGPEQGCCLCSARHRRPFTVFPGLAASALLPGSLTPHLHAHLSLRRPPDHRRLSRPGPSSAPPLQGDAQAAEWLCLACRRQLAALPSTLQEDEVALRSLLLQQEQGVGPVPSLPSADGPTQIPPGPSAPAGCSAGSAGAAARAPAGTQQAAGASAGGLGPDKAALSDNLTCARVALEWRVTYKRTLHRVANG